jgi:hypothetical protein
VCFFRCDQACFNAALGFGRGLMSGVSDSGAGYSYASN